MPWKRSSCLLEMESLPPESVKQRFMNKEFTTRLTEGLNNNIFNDQMIECSYMKTGKGPGGLKGKSDSQEVVKRWAFSIHICGSVDQMMKEYLDTKTSKMKHKEEMPYRIALDEKDRKGLRSTLAGLIHPLDKSQLKQHRELVNIIIYTGEYSELDSTIYRAAEIGRDQHTRFEEALPDGFHSVISRLVIPMKPKKRHRRAVTTSVLISAEVIFSRIVGYLNSGRVEVTIVVALETEV